MKNSDIALKAIKDADVILIGAGAGLSSAAGLTYSGERFKKYFPEFIEKYHIEDMYSAGFYPYPTEEAEWAYWAKHIYHNSYEVGATSLYKKLFELVEDKDYFVITTNVDGQFIKAGFDKERYFEVQGNFEHFQCSVPCQQVVYNNKEHVLKMMDNIDDNLEIPSELIPTCPNCGAPLTRHLRVDNRFVQNETWYRQQKSYAAFLEGLEGKKVVLLELGVGYNTPTIIRYPFEQLTYHLPQAQLIRFNQSDTEGAKENTHKTLTITKDMEEVFASWL
ncbi:SIR2 family NAD-dependent protein deacylase [Streptococcus orisasini]|uniref:SIR2 family NAD-dependent protein deacylase n=1 Tax=Streptococcus orisasini TaxID=1080071 RepID=UPI000708B91F|nr:Sir2 family NAD-dependent protein deacetylase [Streptococcus orisasini]